ncbi:nucleotidyltransferase family protein [Desulfonatronovibrio magnus]|uniref:nucleotidyltransferase family protein n=1 Tax=Desulfonatronovibrio magnus TaxID=698827 RepID=UPI000696D4DE|nr:nucleotidyltransferase domain-containing protein [Desulfonatronovibrio magnus]
MTKTALEMTRQEWTAYSSGVAKHKILDPLSVQKQRKEAMRLANHAAELLRKEYSAKKVILFGTLAMDTGFSEHSDIDLAAYGIPDALFYRAAARVSGLSPEFTVDLVDPDSCRPSVRESILTRGIEL